MTKMTKTLTALAAAATLAVAAVAAPQPAEARGGRIAAGIIGGLAAGAIIGGIASQGGYYGPGYYGGPGYYYGPGPVYYGPHCYWTRQRIWDGYELAPAARAGLRLDRCANRDKVNGKGPDSRQCVRAFPSGRLNLRHQISDI